MLNLNNLHDPLPSALPGQVLEALVPFLSTLRDLCTKRVAQDKRRKLHIARERLLQIELLMYKAQRELRSLEDATANG